MKKKIIIAIISAVIAVSGISAGVIVATQHKHDYRTMVTPPSCTSQGYTTYECECGDKYVDDYIPALGHTATMDKGVNPTCESIGITEGSHCLVCNAILVKQEVLSALGHEYENGICIRCYKPDPENQGHVHTVVINEEVKATCTQTGLTEGAYCSDCKMVLIEQEEIPALGHDYQNGKCVNCGEPNSTPSEYFNFSLLLDDTYSITVKDVNDLPVHVIIPDTYNGKSVTTIGAEAFYNCKSIKSIKFPSTIKRIERGAFSGCSNLTEIYMSDLVAWCNISGLHELMGTGIMIGGVSDRPYLNLYLNNQLITDLVIPECVTKIADGAFSGCTSLTSVTIPNTVTDIGDGAFWSCLSLTSIKIGNSVKNIGREAFLYCYKLVEVINNSEHITVTKGSEQNSYIGYYALSVSNRDSSYQSKISNDNGFIVYNEGEQKLLLGIKDTKIQLVIPSYVTKIYPYACINQLQLASVVIGESVTEIGEHAFRMCIKLVEVINNSSHITVTKGSEENGCVGCFALSVSNRDSSYKSKLSYDNDFIVYDNDNQKVLINYKGTQTKLTIPYGITQINQGAFYGCASLTSIEIPDSVTAIGVGAFYGCASLTSIEIPNSVTEIGESAFSECEALSSVTISASLTAISEAVFSGCTSLTSIKIPNSVTSIGGGAFWGCTALKSIIIPNSVTYIGSFAFCNCTSMEEIILPFIGNSCDFSDSTTLGEIFGHSSQSGNSGYLVYLTPASLKRITITGGVVCQQDFKNGAARNIIIGKGVTEVDANAFNEYPLISSVYYQGSQSEWAQILKNSITTEDITFYFYSESQPNEEGNFWHYAANGEIEVW